MNQTDNHLQWIKKNRKATHTPELVGSVVRVLLPKGIPAAPGWQQSVLAILGPHAGTALLEQVCAASLRRGVLYLEVDDPATLYHLRLQWEQKLLEVLQTEQSTARIRAVRFTARGHKP